MLVDTGALSPKNLRRVLAMQSRVEARFGDILLAQGLIDRARLYATLGRQYDAEIAQFDSTPPDIPGARPTGRSSSPPPVPNNSPKSARNWRRCSAL